MSASEQWTFADVLVVVDYVETMSAWSLTKTTKIPCLRIVILRAHPNFEL